MRRGSLVVITIMIVVFSCGSVDAQIMGSHNGLSFDGVDDQVSYTTQVLPLGQKTISMWIRNEGATWNQTLLENNASTSSLHGTQLSVTPAGLVRFYSSRGVGGVANLRFDVTSITTVNNNEWIHVCAVWDGTTNTNGVQLYVNGILETQGTASTTETVNATHNLTIGTIGSLGVNWVNGQMDEVSVWNIAMSQSQIRQRMCSRLSGNENGLVAYWEMNEGSGTTVGDSSINGNIGTMQ